MGRGNWGKPVFGVDIWVLSYIDVYLMGRKIPRLSIYLAVTWQLSPTGGDDVNV